MSKQVAVAQMGARMHYGVPWIFQSAGLLEHLYTDICAVKGWPRMLGIFPSKILPGVARRLRGRIPEGIPSKRITAYTSFGLEYSIRCYKARSTSEMTAVHLWAGKRFNELIVQNGFKNANVVYGFNSASKGLLQAAKFYGLKGIIEQTIAPRIAERRLLMEEVELFPGWANFPVRDENDDKFISRERQEWILADQILVASEFVKAEIKSAGGPSEKCVVVPYGVELDHSPVQTDEIRMGKKNKPLRVLFVGSIGLRKGIQYLLAAMKKLEQAPIHCRVIGAVHIDKQVLGKNLPENVKLVGHVERSEVKKEYAQADIFCLPSLCEGSATVIYEALAAGLPVITTPNSGSIVQAGVEGYIVPIRDVEAIVERFEQLMENRGLLQEMSTAALARSKYGSLTSYRKRLLEAVKAV